jgi:hypothetical protein
MRKRITLLIAAAIMALTMSFGSMAAFAASPQQQCEAQGGTFFTGEQGTKGCVVEEEGKNPKFDQETETTQKGSFSSSHDPVIDEDCTKDDVETGHCPPGQFKG